jgi:6,7-dimethyl-8-ribityllumazine synthase
VSTQGPYPPEESIPAPSARPWPGEPGPPAPAARPVAAPPVEADAPAARPLLAPPASFPPVELPPQQAAVPEPEPARTPVAEAEPEPAQTPAVEAEPEPEPAPEPLEPAASVADQHAAGELRIPQGYRVLEGAPSGAGRTVGVVVSRFNGAVTSVLLENALAELERLGVHPDAVTVMPVPGAFELPLAAMALAKSRRYACVVALGCVIRGETPHFDYVAGEAASGLQLAGLETGIPVAFGVLTVDTIEQAEARLDKGAEAARTALELADTFARLRAGAESAG